MKRWSTPILVGMALMLPGASQGASTSTRLLSAAHNPKSSVTKPVLGIHVITRPEVSFVNDVIPALTRVGCNQGACHGAAAGKAGFRLSLRGFAPELDYLSITRQYKGRRISISQPLNSLLLKKPLLEVPHLGGRVLLPGTPEYGVLLNWIRCGAPGPLPTDAHVISLQPIPATQSLAPKGSLNLKVLAHFSDGSKRDVSYWARFGTNNLDIADVKPGGAVQMTGFGETAITIAYQDKVAIATLLTPFPNRVSQALYRTIPENGYIDHLIDQKLRQVGLLPSPRATDAEFIRRISLDLTGTLPSAGEIRDFSRDPSPDRREKLIDRLMAGPDYVDYWTYVWSDLFKVNRLTLKDKGMWAFYNYLHESVTANKPWNTLCSEIITSTGNSFLDGPTNYFRTALKTEDLAENVSQGFLGIRVQCAKCHNHPLEHWTQNEYYAMANVFARVGKKVDYTSGIDDEMIVYNLPSGDIVQPRLGRPVPPRPLGGAELSSTSADDRRVQFAKWLTNPNNRQFGWSIVNRVWGRLMGRGLIEPVDDIRATNPPTNPQLLDALTDDFIKHGYDLQRLMRLIVSSEAYQRSSRAIVGNTQDDRYYSRYLVRRLPAEMILDSLTQVTGIPAYFPNMPANYRALQLPDTHVQSEFMDSFGRPARQITCECERTKEPNMTQALLFINGDTVNHMVSADGGLVDRLVKAGKPDSEILDTLYWTALGRPASAAERESDIAAIRSAQKAPQSAPAAESKAAAVTNSGKAAVQTPSVAASNGNKVAQSRTLTAAGGKRKLALTGSLSTTSPTAALARGGTEVAGSSAEMRAASQKLTSAAGTGKLAVGAPVLGGDAKNADFAPHDPAARRRVFEDMLWALVNSKEFLFNH